MYHVCDFPYYSCLSTFWYCHPYFTHQFYANVFFIIIQSNVIYPNKLGPKPVHNFEYSISLKLGKVYVYHTHVEWILTQ